jgi:hypothetical protein
MKKANFILKNVNAFDRFRINRKAKEYFGKTKYENGTLYVTVDSQFEIKMLEYLENIPEWSDLEILALVGLVTAFFGSVYIASMLMDII